MTLPKQFKPNTEIQEMMEKLGCTGKRVKPEDITARIVNIEFKTVNLCGTDLMFCGIGMKTANPERPFVVVGKPSVCIDPDNWRDEIGQQVSFDNTFSEIYKLEAYRKMTTPTPEPAPEKLGFYQYESKPVTRTAYQLTKRDLVTMTWSHVHESNSAKAVIQIEGKKVVFAFHCRPDEIKVGDYVVFLNENDTYHCSEEVFNERNIT